MAGYFLRLYGYQFLLENGYQILREDGYHFLREPGMASVPPIQQARRWWKKHADSDVYVVSPVEVPSAAVARVLRQEGLVMDVAGRRAWILTPERPIDRRAVFLANYWAVLALVLKRYEPAALRGVSAIKVHLGDFSPPEEMRAYQDANQSEYTLTLEPGFTLRLRPHALGAEAVQPVETSGRAQIPVLTAAQILTTLDEREISADVATVSIWLRHLVVRTPDLERASNENPRPVLLHRLADMAGALKNASLARQLEAAARNVSGRISSPSRTGVGTRITVPQVLQQAHRGSGSPWMDEQALRSANFEAETERLFGAQIRKLDRFPWRTLRANAEQGKAYDAYHSTTMEGYRISRDISDAIVRGEPLADGPQDRETLAAAMAIQGYSAAFNEVLQRARAKQPVNTDLILDLYEALFRPSVDAGITDTASLRAWRTSSVGLRGWRYVPPNPKKISDLIGGLERVSAREDIPAITRALFVHLEFVTIHPFMDGNGRLGRLLMNHVLLSGGYPWVTIRSDERLPFFRSIEQAQVDGDPSAFIRFVWHLIRQSMTDLRNKESRKKTRR
jgi:Fic/DOC family protein